MDIFNDYSLVSNEDKKFTEYINSLKTVLEDNFVKYDSGYGYQVNEFEELGDDKYDCK